MKLVSKALLLCCLVVTATQAYAQSIFDQRPSAQQPSPNGAQSPIGNRGNATNTDEGLSLTPNPTVINNRSRGTGTQGIDRPGDRAVDPRRAAGGFPESVQIQSQQPIPQDYKDRLEFQDFVLQSTGRDLPVFGANLFRGAPSTFAPVENIPVTPDYTIGPGDEIIMRAWGQIDVDYSAVVDRNGTISVPKIGSINVSGIKYENLTGLLKSAFGRVFRNFELSVSLGQLRSVQIFVVGQAKRPGTYTVSSLSSLVTALFAVGGPSSRGSMRSIQLKRGNTVVTELDLYELLVSGNKSKDAALLPGDVIYIPPVGELVAITGSVNGAAIYELKRSASLSELIRWAGGLSTTAQGQKVTVERIDQRTVRTVDEFSLDQEGLARNLRDGDLVTVFALTPRFGNAVTLRGNVAQPGRFPWRPGMKVRDLLPNREALLTREYWQKQGQIVGMEQSVSRILQEQEVLGIRLGVTDLIERPLRDEQDITVGDAIRRRKVEKDASVLADRGDRRKIQAAIDPTRLVNQITPSLKEVNWDYAVIERLGRVDLRTSLIPFNLGKAVLEGDPQQNLSLEPGDIITVFSREDIEVSKAKQTKFIRLEGEFAAPGIYQIQPGETLRQLTVRVGGLSQAAYLFGSEFTRESTRLQQQKNLEEALNRMEQEVQRASVTRAQNIVNAEDAATIKTQAESQQQMVARLRQIRATGRIVIEVPDTGTVKNLPDLPLEDGDRFFVPSQPSMVNVYGAVYSENSFIFKPEKRVSDYLAQAGGPTRYADQGSVYVIRADGSVISKRQSGFLVSSMEGLRLMPGDSLVVPEELDRTTTTRMLRDVSQIFYQFGLGAAALKVLKGN